MSFLVLASVRALPAVDTFSNNRFNKKKPRKEMKRRNKVRLLWQRLMRSFHVSFCVLDVLLRIE